MKRYILMLSMAGALLAGCSKDEETTASADDTLVPIELTCNMGADMDIDISDTRAATRTLHLYVKEGDCQANSADFSGGKWIDAKVEDSGTDPRPVTLSETLYYNVDNDIPTNICGYWSNVESHTEATTYSGKPAVKTDPENSYYNFAFAKVVSGSKHSPIGQTLEFVKPYAQIRVCVIAGDGADGKGTIRKATVSNLWFGTTFYMSGDPVSAASKSFDLANAVGKSITSNEQHVASLYTLPTSRIPVATVTTDKNTYSNIALNPPGGQFEAGKSYTFVLRFSQKRCTVSAAITPWQNAVGINIDVQQ